MTIAVEDALFETRLALPNRRQGKVRDVYELPRSREGESPRLLIIATDRISAFDVVMPTPIPGKGRMLTALSLAWFKLLRRHAIVPDHLLSDSLESLPGVSAADRSLLEGRSMLCRAARVVPIECVVRGYLAGSGWKEYRESGRVCGVPLPPGLKQCDQLPEPIFTPASKATEGHDENITFDDAASRAGGDTMKTLREMSLRIYTLAAEHARSRGIILADTKFEFGHALDADGRPTSQLMIVDEVLTPDSSRYWPLDLYQPGRDQPSFDKQYLRDWLLALEKQARWNRTPPGPELPAEVVAQTAVKYREALDRLAVDKA